MCITKSHSQANNPTTYRRRKNSCINKAESDEEITKTRRHFRYFHDTPSIVLYWCSSLPKIVAPSLNALTRSRYRYTQGNKCSDSWKSEGYRLERSRLISKRDNGTEREEESSRLEMCAHAHAHEIEKRTPTSIRVDATNKLLQTELFANWRWASKLLLVDNYCKPTL